MDKTELVKEVAYLFEISGYEVDVSVLINFREIDVVAKERQGLVRKTVLVECANYSTSVGIDKLQEDIRKLEAARHELGHQAVIMHVSLNGYTQNASGYALSKGIPCYKLSSLKMHLINFEEYVKFVKNDPQRQYIIAEYQPTTIHREGYPDRKVGAVAFIKQWLKKDKKWLTILGDYGVGKSWLLKKTLYELTDEYTSDPMSNPLPFFVPLQKFTKAFDFKTLVVKTLDSYGVSGITYESFRYLASTGSILFLLDSFDEMAQTLSRNTLRENLRELLSCVSGNSKALMTSRPTYFESRSERLMLIENEGELAWHPIDREVYRHQSAVAMEIDDKIQSSQFCRLNDLTIAQRKKLFKIVLRDKQSAYQALLKLFEQFQELESISQRAVIARYLTVVAETLASENDSGENGVGGYGIVPAVGERLNQSKIFEIVIYNLLQRDVNIGELKAEHRLLFLRTFALYLQNPNNSFFAPPFVIKTIVELLYKVQLSSCDSYQQMLENYYRTCRRHSGLTTEKQFLDTSGYVDFPVNVDDADSNVGFSHNSLREFLVAESLCDFIVNDKGYHYLDSIFLTSAICEFIYGISEYKAELVSALEQMYSSALLSKYKEIVFKIIFHFIGRDSKYISLLGSPPVIDSMDLSYMDFSGLSLVGASISNCIAYSTDFRKSDLRRCVFDKTIIERALFDDSSVELADFTKTELVSLYVYDEYVSKTSAFFGNKQARQWLFTKRAIVSSVDDLNPLLGKPWYHATQEVAKTLETKIAGSFHESSLYKGTKNDYRDVAKEFVEYLKNKNILIITTSKSKLGYGDVVKLNPKYRDVISDFSRNGTINDLLEGFFKDYKSEYSLNIA
jgi:hypothetical protein